MRSRWVLQDIAKTAGEGAFFSPTPDAWLIEVAHAYAGAMGFEVRYLDFHRAFLHTPETEVIYTSPLGLGRARMVLEVVEKDKR